MPTSGSSTTRCGGWARSTAAWPAARDRAAAVAPPGQRVRTFGTEDIDFGDFGGLGDIFSSIFGRGRQEEPARAETIETVVEVPFRVATLGGKVPVTLQVTEQCPTCTGSGGAPGATWSTCPECNGRGTISFGQGGFAVNRPCPQCRGRGRIPSQPCPTCRGAGEVRTERQIDHHRAPGHGDRHARPHARAGRIREARRPRGRPDHLALGTHLARPATGGARLRGNRGPRPRH